MKQQVDEYLFIFHIFPLMECKFAREMYFRKGKANHSAVEVVSLSGCVYL